MSSRTRKGPRSAFTGRAGPFLYDGVFTSIGQSAGFTLAVIVSVTIVLFGYVPYRNRARDRMMGYIDLEGRPLSSPDAASSPNDGGASAYGLTKREAEILAFLAQHETISAMAESLCVSTSTVKSHVLHIHQKLGIHSREELAALVACHESEG